MADSRDTLIIGLGSSHGDDQVGWLVADAVSRLVPAASVARAASPADILDRLTGLERLIICDACRSGGAVGTLLRWDWPNVQSIGGMACGTHDMNLIAMLQLAENLGRLPRRVTIWGIEIDAPRPAASLSPALGPLIPRLAQSIVADISGI